MAKVAVYSLDRMVRHEDVQSREDLTKRDA